MPYRWVRYPAALVPITLIDLIGNVTLAGTPTLNLTWQPVTTMSDGTPIPMGHQVTYNIYGGHSVTGPFTLAANVNTTSAVRNNVDLGVDCYQVTAVVNSVESLPTPTICVTVTETVSTVPSAPLNLAVKQTQ